MADYVWVYMTAKNAREAGRIGRGLVERRLAACVNFIGPIRSIYRWDGRICNGREVAFIAKTRRSLVPKLTEAVKELHSYECPCIVALPISGGNADFLGWIAAETQQASGSKRTC